MAETLIERLDKLAKAAQERSDNSRVVADYLAPEIKALQGRTGHNIYAARMAVDHRNSARTDAEEAATLCQAATELEALRKRCEAVEFELDCLRTQHEERTAYTIVHRGAVLCCSSAMRDAYSDEHHRAERLAKALNIAHRHIDMAALRISHAKDAEAIAAAQETSHG